MELSLVMGRISLVNANSAPCREARRRVQSTVRSQTDEAVQDPAGVRTRCKAVRRRDGHDSARHLGAAAPRCRIPAPHLKRSSSMQETESYRLGASKFMQEATFAHVQEMKGGKWPISADTWADGPIRGRSSTSLPLSVPNPRAFLYSQHRSDSSSGRRAPPPKA